MGIRLLLYITWQQVFMLVAYNFHHLLSFLGQYLLDVALAIQIGEPVQVVRNQMVIRTSFAGDNDDAAIVGNLRDVLHVSCLANFTRIDQLHFCLQLCQRYATGSNTIGYGCIVLQTSQNIISNIISLIIYELHLTLVSGFGLSLLELLRGRHVYFLFLFPIEFVAAASK